MSRVLILLLVVASMMLGALPGRAQQAGDREGGFPGDVPDKLHVYVGGVYATFDTSFSYNPSESGVGLALNYEAFGLPESGIDPSLGGRWRISRRGSLYFGYNGSSREGNIALEEDVEIGDYTLLASTHLAIDFEGNIVHAGYRYDAYDNGEVRIAGSAGLSWVELKTGFQAEGAVLDPHGQLVTGVYAESYSVSAPAPQIGFAIDWAFSRRAEARVYLRTLYVDLGDVRGNFTSGGAEAVWFPWRQLGFGLGFERTDVDLREYQGDDFYARGGFGQSGAQLFLEVAF